MLYCLSVRLVDPLYCVRVRLVDQLYCRRQACDLLTARFLPTGLPFNQTLASGVCAININVITLLVEKTHF